MSLLLSALNGAFVDVSSTLMIDVGSFITVGVSRSDNVNNPDQLLSPLFAGTYIMHNNPEHA